MRTSRGPAANHTDTRNKAQAMLESLGTQSKTEKPATQPAVTSQEPASTGASYEPPTTNTSEPARYHPIANSEPTANQQQHPRTTHEPPRSRPRTTREPTWNQSRTNSEPSRTNGGTGIARGSDKGGLPVSGTFSVLSHLAKQQVHQAVPAAGATARRRRDRNWWCAMHMMHYEMLIWYSFWSVSCVSVVSEPSKFVSDSRTSRTHTE